VAFKKTASAEVADIISLRDWERMQGSGSFRSRTASSNAKKLAADQSKYLLSHCTIMASVAVEDDPFDFWVKPETSLFVNGNRDCWSNEVLRLSYRSFVGAFNFLEHYQNSQASKGHILDAVLRKVHITDETYIYYCDILVATDLAHTDLIDAIKSNKTKWLSMGCLTDLVICSFCGSRCTDPDTYCQHLLYRKGTFMFDDGGVPRIVAELCGHKSLPNGGVKFVEASWVGTPAFPGAANRTIVLDEWVGPKTPYSHLAAQQTGIKKAASQRRLHTGTETLEDRKRQAEFLRTLRG
jgi:hypothetical protein